MREIEQSIGVRDAIISAFLDLPCRERIRDFEDASEVVAIARVSESAFCEQFQSKEALVSAFLKDRHVIWMRWFENEIEQKYEETGGGLEIIADVLQKGFEDPKCSGFAFFKIVPRAATSTMNLSQSRESRRNIWDGILSNWP